ncbi:hypothetical protein ID0992_08950 [Helicobacter pylori]
MQAAQETSVIEQAKHSSDRFNQAIIEENQYAYYLNHLVSPISAKGIYLNHLEMDFLYMRACATSKIPSNGFLKSPILNKQSKNCKTRFKILKKTYPD